MDPSLIYRQFFFFSLFLYIASLCQRHCMMALLIAICILWRAMIVALGVYSFVTIGICIVQYIIYVILFVLSDDV